MREGLALLASYLLSSARGLLDEPPDYGHFRCMDGARRALELLDAESGKDPRVIAVRTRLDELSSAAMNTQDITGPLDDLCLEMARVVKDSMTRETDAKS
ncbi:DUF6092 family protein [Actinosynnema sp. CS-041913]|uniref:DUF6092 family protein n=1 Tax=Actinosynnema sp. CS-041913 TaxID=3239917 RepID=UPI003D94FD98